ncbi:MAG: hypothetical protein JNM22_19440 [Saprospiraceae bacterium]|nr:hypothetical protein [Saprospiraceae bacterium]
MRDLIELTNLLNTTKMKGDGMMKFIIEPNTKMERLYEALISKKVKSDEDAKTLFGDQESATNLTGLKNKLKERLLDSVFLLDFKEANFSSRQKAFYECYKKWSVAMTLLTRNAKITGIDLLERLQRHSIHFEFTELTLDIMRVLKLQYSVVEGDMEKYQDAKNKYFRYEHIWMMESKAENYYSELMIQFTNSKSTKTEVTDLAKTYYAELEGFMKECDSFKLHLFGRMIQLTIYNSANDYFETARLCEDAIAFFDKKEYDSGLPLQVFYYNLVVCYLQLREFEKGQEVIGRCEYFFTEGTFNWYKLQELFFLLAMHSGHYEEAYRLYEKITNYPRFNEQAHQIVEMWKIYEAYVQFLIRIGEIPDEMVSEKARKFRVGKFLNEVNEYIKDKRGMNISVLIAQILFNIADRDYDEAIERIDAIEKYRSRHLKEDDTFRSNCFIKMLLQIPLVNFHREAVLRKADRFHKNLLTVPLESATQMHEVEIIPYEPLWDMIIRNLELKIYNSKKKK